MLVPNGMPFPQILTPPSAILSRDGHFSKYQGKAMNLERLGWNVNDYGRTSLGVARVASADRDIYTVISEDGLTLAEPLGRLLYSAETAADLPKTGDWVTVFQRGGCRPGGNSRSIAAQIHHLA